MTTTVIGLGRFGRCMATLLSPHTPVNYLDPNVNDTHFARIDIAELGQSERVFLCVPISQMQSVLASIAPYLTPGTVVLDTCSVKVLPCQWMLSALPEHIELIATHPLFGPDSQHDIHTVITHPLRCSTAHLDAWIEQCNLLHLDPVIMSPEEHDQTIGITQSITHYVGRLLEGVTRPSSEHQTLGYQKLCQVQEQTCNDPWQLFIDILQYNPYNRALLNDIQHQQQALHSTLQLNEATHGN